MSGFTKEIIAKTFTELLDEKPMSKITVKDIVERCGVNRNTFYYHFKDIPDVVEFILKKKWDEILEHPRVSMLGFETREKKRTFFVNFFPSSSPSPLLPLPCP